MTYPTVTIEDVKNFIVSETYTVLPNGRTTICQLILKNDFSIEGSSACVSKENFDEVKGKTYAKKDAVEKVWSYLGFDLASKVSLLKGAGEATGDILRVGKPKTYVGTKVVRALPMTRKAYTDMRGWDLPKDEVGTDPGFLIEYVDGGSSNVHGFTGYISWSPADVFERAYSIGIPAQVSTPESRLHAELSELQERYKKLNSFLGSNMFGTLSVYSQELLRRQAVLQNELCKLLQERIEVFK